MKGIFYCLFILIVGMASAQSDTTFWIGGGLTSLTFSQVSLENWTSGGQQSVALNGLGSFFADYKKSRHSWENSLDIAYGLIRQGGKEVDFTKSDDKINLVTKYGYRVKNQSEHWYFSALLDFRTQFARGFAPDNPDSLISKFLAPGYLVVGLGIDYKPNKVLSFNYIPLTGKVTIVNNDSLSNLGAYGVDPGDKVRAELGSYFRIKYKDEILKNINIDSRLELFSNYVENFGNIDVNWQNTLVMKVNKFITANYFVQLIYDDDIKIESESDPTSVSPRIQFKSVLGIGLTYNFGASRDK